MAYPTTLVPSSLDEQLKMIEEKIKPAIDPGSVAAGTNARMEVSNIAPAYDPAGDYKRNYFENTIAPANQAYLGEIANVNRDIDASRARTMGINQAIAGQSYDSAGSTMAGNVNPYGGGLTSQGNYGYYVEPERRVTADPSKLKTPDWNTTYISASMAKSKDYAPQRSTTNPVAAPSTYQYNPQGQIVASQAQVGSDDTIVHMAKNSANEKRRISQNVKDYVPRVIDVKGSGNTPILDPASRAKNPDQLLQAVPLGGVATSTGGYAKDNLGRPIDLGTAIAYNAMAMEPTMGKILWVDKKNNIVTSKDFHVNPKLAARYDAAKNKTSWVDKDDNNKEYKGENPEDIGATISSDFSSKYDQYTRILRSSIKDIINNNPKLINLVTPVEPGTNKPLTENGRLLKLEDVLLQLFNRDISYDRD